jgi:hypothetical protein
MWGWLSRRLRRCCRRPGTGSERHVRGVDDRCGGIVAHPGRAQQMAGLVDPQLDREGLGSACSFAPRTKSCSARVS